VAREHFEPGQEVFHQGDIGDRVYIVLSGRAEVLHENGAAARVLATLGRGQYFGEMALLHSTTRNATVRCVEAMDVLSLPKKEFNLLATNLPELRTSFERTSAERGAALESTA
jgi:NADH dehydrogenase